MSPNQKRPFRGRGRGRGPERTPKQAIEPLHPSAEPPDVRSFREWALAPEVQDVIEGMGITTPTPIQRLAIQPALDGRDVIAKAETGTGKTLAFGAPILSRIDPARSTVLALVLCPTRELAQQVCGVLSVLGASRGVRSALIVGGEPMNEQIDALKQGAQVVVGTPGRVLDLYGQGFLSFPWTEFVVLDEADEMLEIGFLDDVRKILSFTPPERQTLHFSATFPHDVLELARESTREPVEIATAKGVATVATIEQSYIRVDDEDRPAVLRRLIESGAEDDVFLVFCDRRTEVDKLMRVMERMPFPTKALHGGFDQPSRFRVMSAFRSGEVKALVATDVAARGLDVAHVTHVVNFSVPQDVQDYTHRIGRTGRAGRAGKAITLVTRRSESDWRSIQKSAPWDIPEAEAPQAQRDERRPRRSEDQGRAPRRFERERRPRDGERDGEPRPTGTEGARERPPRADSRDRGRPPQRPEREPAPRAAESVGERSARADNGRGRRQESTRERLRRERGEAPAPVEADELKPVPARPARERELERERERPQQRSPAPRRKPTADEGDSSFGSGV